MLRFFFTNVNSNSKMFNKTFQAREGYTLKMLSCQENLTLKKKGRKYKNMF